MNNFPNLREQFTNKENLNLLWNVLLDEFNINNSNKNEQDFPEDIASFMKNLFKK